MISVFLPGYPFRGVKASYLWFFYRIVTSVQEPVYFLMGEDYLTPLAQWQDEGRWEMLPDSQKRLGYTLHDVSSDQGMHHFSILDESFFDDYLKKCFNNPDELFKKFITGVIPELDSIISAGLSKRDDIECVLTWCNCPSLNVAAARHGIKVINLEIGPLRAPEYLSTAYLDFTGVNGNTEAEARYHKSSYRFNDKLNADELREFFTTENPVRYDGRLSEGADSVYHRQGNIEEISKGQKFETGIVFQVENDSNILAFNNTFSNQSLLDYSEIFFPDNRLIRMHPGSNFTLKNENYSLDHSSTSRDFILRCNKILTINSSVGFEALLLDVPVTVVGDCSYAFCCVTDREERSQRLAFYLFAYLVPFELLFDVNYLRFRLSAPAESTIIEKHMDHYLSHRKKRVITHLENQLGNIIDHNSMEKNIHTLLTDIHELKSALSDETNENERLKQEVVRLEMALSEQTGEYIVDVIIPVYAGLEETRECIESALQTLPDWAQLIVINDASPDAELTCWLRERAVTAKFRLIENQQNLGFVATVNRGMQLNPQRDILLLNSDVEVANDWLERLREAAYSRQDVGSITPFSNNATICSFPRFCEDNVLFMGLDVRQLDNHFSTYGTRDNLVEIPTGVGFCMYIRRDCLNATGYFDVETFGRGYGEENDWCQRAIKAGWKNFHQFNVFVFHKGGVSFAGEQSPRKKRALELLNELHPNYTKDVMDFIARDPAKKARQQMVLRIIASKKISKVLFISHKMGGGVPQHLQELSNYYSDKIHFLLLTPSEDGKSVALSLSMDSEMIPDKFIIQVDKSYDTLISLLRFIGVGHLHFHHMIGMPQCIFELNKALACSYDITAHDYYFVNANPTLTDKNGIFAGDDIALCDKLCREHYPLPDNQSAETWRSSIGPWLANATRVIFPSADTQYRFLRYFPQCADNSIVAWHPDYEVSAPYPEASFTMPQDTPLKVLVLGALSREKGALMLEEVAGNLLNENIEFHLLGYAFKPLGKAVKSHGAYTDDELLQKIEQIQPHIIWFPAQWPETYSYTLSIALEHGLPVVVPDIGAFAERVCGRAYSRIVKWNTSAEKMCDLWRSLLADPGSFFAVQHVHPLPELSGDVRSLHFYRDKYVQPDWLRDNELGRVDYQSLISDVYGQFKMAAAGTVLPQGRKEKLLVLLWRLSHLPGIAWCVKLIPYRVQRFIKRHLSRRAIHEIVILPGDNGHETK